MDWLPPFQCCWRPLPVALSSSLESVWIRSGVEQDPIPPWDCRRYSASFFPRQRDMMREWVFPFYIPLLTLVLAQNGLNKNNSSNGIISFSAWCLRRKACTPLPSFWRARCNSRRQETSLIWSICTEHKEGNIVSRTSFDSLQFSRRREWLIEMANGLLN